MSRHNKQTKGIVQRQGQHVAFTQQEIYDDNYLPSADELAKYKQLDPDIINWIKERTEKEQDSRIDFNNRKMKLLESDQQKNFIIDICTIIAAFTILILGMFFSYHFIEAGRNLEGAIFGGGTLLFAANAFLNFRNKIVKATKQ